jgi:hypothetical protein
MGLTGWLHRHMYWYFIGILLLFILSVYILGVLSVFILGILSVCILGILSVFQSCILPVSAGPHLQVDLQGLKTF